MPQQVNGRVVRRAIVRPRPEGGSTVAERFVRPVGSADATWATTQPQPPLSAFGREWLPRWKAALVARNFAANTIDAYGRDAAEFVNFITFTEGLTHLDEIQPMHVQHWLEHLAGAGNRPTTRNRKLASVSSLAKWLQTEDVVPKLFTRGVTGAKKPDRIPRALIEGSVEKLLNMTAAKPRDYALVALLAYTGARGCEVRGLQWQDVDFDADCIVFRNAKGGKERVVPMDDRLRKILLAYRRHCLEQRVSPTPYLFPGKGGARPISRSEYHAWLRPYLDQVGSEAGKATGHQVRHTVATELLKNGAEITAVGDLLGHKDIQTTAQYGKTTLRRQRQVLETLYRDQ